MLRRLRSSDRRLLDRLTTLTAVQNWLNGLAYNPADSMHTLPDVLRRKRVHCLEAAMAAAAILEPHGFPPLILDLESADGLDHTLFLYRRRGRYGSIGRSRDIGLGGRRPVFPTIRSLVASYAIPYIDHRAAITAYGVLDLRTLSRQEWRDSQRQVWYVERALWHIPHRTFRMPDATMRYWRQRYIAWRQKHPMAQPDFYPNQRSWT